MTFRARKPSAKYMSRILSADPETLIAHVASFLDTGAGRRTRRSLLSDRSGTGNKENNIHTTAARIATEEGNIDGFLKYMPAFFAVKSLTRKLLLWRTGYIPGKIQSGSRQCLQKREAQYGISGQTANDADRHPSQECI